MLAQLAEPILHTVVALALLAAYVTLRALGQDEPTLLGILVGQLGGLGLTRVGQRVERVANGPSSSPGS